MSATSPSDTNSPASLPTPLTPASTVALDHDAMERKRARDRNSQRRMRERTKGAINDLTQEVDKWKHETEQWKNEVGHWKHELDGERCAKREMEHRLQSRIRVLEEQYERANNQRNALQLLIAHGGVDGMGDVNYLAVYQRVPPHVKFTCLSDEIIQYYICSRWKRYAVQASVTSPTLPIYPESADLEALINNKRSTTNLDDTTSASTIITDIVLRYPEIDTFPKKVAVHWVMFMLLKWMVLRTEASYEALPWWLKPVPLQIEQPHPCWIDRIPWPNVRHHLIVHQIGFEEFAKVYSWNFDIEWEFDHRHVFVKDAAGTKISPIFEENIRRLDNWTIADKFKNRFPEMSKMIEAHRIESKIKREGEEKKKREAEEEMRRKAEEDMRRELEDRIKKELEEQIRKQVERKMRKEFEDKMGREMGEKMGRPSQLPSIKHIEEMALGRWTDDSGSRR